MNKKEMQAKLKAALSEGRFEHSMGVCKEAVKLAGIFGADTDKAYIAGLLHDCAKCLSYEEEAELSAKYNFVPDEITAICHPILHAPLGAVVAMHEYGVEDREILDAICFHTAARSEMTLLDKIIYVADMTEPNRDYEGVELLRKLAVTDIDVAFKEAIRRSLVYNLKKGTVIHPNTLDAWNTMCEIN